MDRNSVQPRKTEAPGASLSARRAWIEIWCIFSLYEGGVTSLSARRAWIEISVGCSTSAHVQSLSARRAWIEILIAMGGFQEPGVALRKESVDRNLTSRRILSPLSVALRKESVDRNAYNGAQLNVQRVVALRKESVDRNDGSTSAGNRVGAGRSPQGERG